MAIYGVMSLCLNLCCFLVFALSQSQPDEFIFNGFNDSNGNITLHGASIFKPSGVLKLSNLSSDNIDQAFYHSPVQMLARNSTSNSFAALSFSTHFVFAIKPPLLGEGSGYGLAFAVAPKTSFLRAQVEKIGERHYITDQCGEIDENSHVHVH